MRQVGSVLWPKLRVLQVYGANTGVGKTIFSSILCRAFQKSLPTVHYLKPVSTGPLDEADDRHLKTVGSVATSSCLFQFDEPVSPHIAVRSAGKPVTDATVLTAVYDSLKSQADGGEGITIVETAGGVLSPSPSGSSQADLYRPLRLPTLLIGDHQLGGIGTTISAWESLHIRGYDVDSVALFAEDRYGNHAYLRDYFRERQVSTVAVPPPPPRCSTLEEDVKAMREFYEKSSQHDEVLAFTERFLTAHDNRIKDIRSMPAEAHSAIWHPFMQHNERSKDTITAWDSAYGDHFQSYTTLQDGSAVKSTESQSSEKSVLNPAFDGSASWWTQGLGHGNPSLVLAAASAAGRYGHVMFGGAIHKPALDLAQTLISKSDNPKLSKVFYSDNGSTGMEVAVKMALRASVIRHGRGQDIRILGLKNSYHGDTMGTMDMSEPSIYNEKVEWYQGRGIWLDFPTVKMRQGQWLIEPHDSMEMESRNFGHVSDVFDFEGRSEDYERYKSYLHKTISEEVSKTDCHLGALVIEPILLGAGGMMFADPLYQKCLVEVAREFYDSDPDANVDGLDWSSIPVIFDEVFTGLYRLGRFTAASFLGVHPDIVVNAKLLTGGLLPLATTTASESIFNAFLSSDKTDALLHGHSYTAHPIGCSVANESLRQLQSLDRGEAWKPFKQDWSATSRGSDRAWGMWSQDFVSATSHKDSVDSVFALGSVFAMSLKDPQGAGYASTAAVKIRDELLRGGPAEHQGIIHSRVLGNVLYLMAAMTTTEETISGIQKRVLEVLQ